MDRNYSLVIQAALITVTLLFLIPEPVWAEQIPEKPDQTAPCMGDRGYQDTWLDHTHAFFTQQFCQPAVWFDNFFGDDRANEEGWPGSSLRIKGTYRLDQEEDDSFRTSIKSSVRLPNVSNRLKLVLTAGGEEEGQFLQADEDPISQEVVEGDAGGETSLALRWHILRSRKTKVTVGGGARLESPLVPFIRVRLRHTEPIGDRTQVRLVPTYLAVRDEGVTRSVRLDLERLLGSKSLVRLSQSVKRQDNEYESVGHRWGTELSLLTRLTKKRALSLEVGQEGITRPSTITTTYRIGTRYRVQFHRPWLYYEIEPEVYWPRDEIDGSYKRVYAISFRLEINFIS
jgi:hypothetical protein